MRQPPSTEPKFADAALRSDTVPATALAQSALQLTRAAIARWSGSTRPPSSPVRELPRISPQARWVAQAQDGLETWIAHGGFSQPDEAPLATPLIHNGSAAPQRSERGADACID